MKMVRELTKIESGGRYWLCGKGGFGVPTLDGGCQKALELIKDQEWYSPERHKVEDWEILGHHSIGTEGQIRPEDEIEKRVEYGCRYVYVFDAPEADGPFDGDIRERLLAVLGIPEDRWTSDHVVTIKENGWHMAHPITCGLSKCEFDLHAQDWSMAPRDLGRYRWSKVDQTPSDWPSLPDDIEGVEGWEEIDAH